MYKSMSIFSLYTPCILFFWSIYCSLSLKKKAKLCLKGQKICINYLPQFDLWPKNALFYWCNSDENVLEARRFVYVLGETLFAFDVGYLDFLTKIK